MLVPVFCPRRAAFAVPTLECEWWVTAASTAATVCCSCRHHERRRRCLRRPRGSVIAMQRHVDHLGSNKGKRALRAVTLESERLVASVVGCRLEVLDIDICSLGLGVRLFQSGNLLDGCDHCGQHLPRTQTCSAGGCCVSAAALCGAASRCGFEISSRHTLGDSVYPSQVWPAQLQLSQRRPCVYPRASALPVFSSALLPRLDSFSIALCSNSCSFASRLCAWSNLSPPFPGSRAT